MEVILIGYREWALNAFLGFNKPVIKSMKELNELLESYKKKNRLCLIFVGWSDIISSDIIKNHKPIAITNKIKWSQGDSNSCPLACHSKGHLVRNYFLFLPRSINNSS